MDGHTTQVMQDRITAYHAILKEWEAKLDQLDAKVRISYEAERDGFSKELTEAWQDLTEAKLEEYMTQIEGSFQNLKISWDEYFDSTDSANT